MTINFHPLKACSLLLVLALAGCAKYRPNPLQDHFHGYNSSNGATIQDLIISAAKLSAQECKRVFSRRVNRKGYRAIQLSIRNTSDACYELDMCKTELVIEPVRSVAKSLHVHTAKRTLSLVIPGIFFCWPLVVAGGIECACCLDANNQLNKDFDRRVIDQDDVLIVPPHTTIQKVFFVSRSYVRNSFKMAYRKHGSNEFNWLTIVPD